MSLATLAVKFTDSLYDGAYADLADHNYDVARTLLQVRGEVRRKMDQCSWTGTGENSFEVRRLNSLLLGAYLNDDPGVIAAFRRHKNIAAFALWNARKTEISVPDEAGIDGSLRNEATYLRLAETFWDHYALKDASVSDVSQLRTAWQEFGKAVATRHDRLYVEEAEYNASLAEVLVLRSAAPTAERRVARKIAAEGFKAFAAEHPTSYLADDALLLAARFALANGDRNTGVPLLRALFLRYADSDSITDLRNYIGDNLAHKTGEDVEDCFVVADTLIGLALFKIKPAEVDASRRLALRTTASVSTLSSDESFAALSRIMER